MTIVILWCEVLLFDADDVMIITKSHMKSVTKVKFVVMFDPAVEGCFRPQVHPHRRCPTLS